MLASMLDQFILNKIVSKIVTIDQDHSKYERYEAILKTNNNEYNHHHAIGSTGINDSEIFSSYIYKNTIESR